MASCSTCFYSDKEAVRCLRNAPVVVGDRAHFPAVSPNSWCGQHKEKQAVLPKTYVRITDAPRSSEDIHE